MSQPPYNPYDPNDPNWQNQQNQNPQNPPPNDPNSWQNQQNQNPPPNPYQQNPYNQNPYNQNPYNQNPYNQNPYGQPWQVPGSPFGMQRDLPNASGVLVLGIISIVGSMCYAVPGLVCSIISLLMANKSMSAYGLDPAAFTQSSYNNTKAGRICAIIGLCLSAIMLIVFILAFVSAAGRRSYYDYY